MLFFERKGGGGEAYPVSVYLAAWICEVDQLSPGRPESLVLRLGPGLLEAPL